MNLEDHLPNKDISEKNTKKVLLNQDFLTPIPLEWSKSLVQG